MRVSVLIKATLAIPAALVFAGFGIGTIEIIPPYGLVFLDDNTKTYIALPCLEEWERRPTETVDILRRSTSGEAIRRHYKMDEQCRQAGGFREDGRSLTGLLLVRLGILSPAQHWWDAPYRTEEGVVVFPGR